MSLLLPGWTALRVQIEIFRTLFTIFRRRGVSLRVLDQSIDTSTAAGKCFFDMLAAFSEFEIGIRKERQSDGIAKAKAKGVYKGRKALIENAIKANQV